MSSQYEELIEGTQGKVKEVGLGEYTQEELGLMSAIETMKLVKSKYSPAEVHNYVRILQHASRLQRMAPEFKREALRELRKMKMVQEIVDFDWIL